MYSKKRLLIVDDDEDIREILSFNLENEGYDILAVSSSEEAQMILKKQKFDLLILDIMMGGMSGLRLAEEIRRVMSPVPSIIFLTAKITENDMLTGFSLGADDYISKPFSIKEISARVKAVLRRGKGADDKLIVSKNMEIDISQKLVRIKDEVIILTKKEFEILSLLLSAPNHVFSRNDILDKVWNGDSLVLERTVDVHIARLRKKLKSESNRISNRSGYGYCFEE